MSGLQNSGFEGISKPGGWTRQTHDGQEWGEIYVPEGWVAFWREGDYRRPEMKVIPKQMPFLDPARIHEGNWAVQAFTFYGRMHAGLYQVVTGLTPGARYEFTVQAHAWSTTPGLPNCDDAHCSAGVGCRAAYLLPNEVPLLNGDPVNDAIGNFLFQVGAGVGDPDPYGDGVDWWCAGAHIYNQFAAVPPIRFTAPANGRAVVYVRATSLWEFRTSDIYLDSATLTEVEDEPPPAYDCTTLVLPQDATRPQLDEILDLAYPKRNTFCFSNDDSGRLGGLTKLYNIPLADRQRYLDWYAERYPQTTVEFAQTSDWDDDGLLIGQCDEPWRLQRYGDGGGPTYCAKGCWICDCASAQRYLGIDPVATPLTVDAAVGPGGYNADYAMTWDAMPDLGLKVIRKTTDADLARAHLDAGGVCFAEVLPVSLQHFVMVTRYSAERYWMYDPWKRKATWVDEHYNGVESWRLIEKAEAPVLPPPDLPLIGLHLQAMQAGALDFVSAVKPRVMKIFQAENAQAIKTKSPETLVVLRYYTPDQPLDGDLAQSAWDYVASFADTVREHAQWIDYVESWNETVPSCNATAIRRAVEFDCHFADALAARGFGVAPVLLNVAVGNPYHKDGEIELLLPAVAKIIQYGGAAGYHSYWLYNDQVVGPGQDWKYFAGRWQEWDKVFVAHGYRPRYIFGECGAFASCNDGWRAGMCCGGDWDKYQAQILDFQARLVAWNATHGDRALGGTLFTTCPHWMNWESFRITEPEMIKLAQVLTT